MPNLFNTQWPRIILVFSVLLGYSSINTSASAAILLKSFTTPTNDPPQDFNTKLYSLQGRIGGVTTYEFNYEGVTNGGASDQTVRNGTINENWLNDQAVDWQLDWNPATKTASFKLTSAPDGSVNPTVITSQFIGPVGTGTGKFDGFSLLARALTSGVVEPGSLSQVTVSEITVKKKDNSLITDSSFIISPDATNPGPTSLDISATSPASVNTQVLNKSYFALNDSSYDEILQLKGTGLMSWLSGNPLSGGNSRLTFQVDGFNTTRSLTPATTPEPGVTVALVSVGALITLSKRLKK